MIYTYAAILIAILVLIFLIVRWWNLPKVIEARREAAEAAQKRRFERRDRWFGRKTPKPAVPEVKPPSTEPNKEEDAPAEESPKQPEPEVKPDETPGRRRWLPWRRRKN